MAKAKSATPQSKPAAAAKKNVKAKQAAVKAETKKVVPKKASTLPSGMHAYQVAINVSR